jgi:integrase
LILYSKKKKLTKLTRLIVKPLNKLDLSPFYEQKYNEFKEAYPNYARYSIHLKYCFHYFQNANIDSFVNAKPDDMINFMCKMSEKYSSVTMSRARNIIAHARKLFGDEFVPGFSFDSLLTAKKGASGKIFKAFPKDELNIILENIDAKTEKGIRDFAIIILGACLGIRACDIANLKLHNFNWNSKTLNFVQLKTGKQLFLPLNNIAGDAVFSYIENGRPSINSEYVFISARAPLRHFPNGSAISQVILSRMKSAGVSHVSGDGKSFHGLRRFFATELLNQQTPIHLVAQALGQSGIGTVKQYIDIDIEHLRLCALDLDSITVDKL